MANKKTEDKLDYTNAVVEQQGDPADMMAQLQQLQAQIMAQMAELQAAKAAQPVKTKPAVSNAWDEKRTVFLPRAMGREQKFLLVGVNGRRYQVPRGKPVEVPLPLAERIEIMLDAEERAIKARDAWDAEAEEAEQVLTRVL